MPSLERRKVGELDCQIVTAESPGLLVVLAHGFGAPGDDLVPLGPHLLQLNPKLVDRAVIAFPAAPLSLADYGYPVGRAWWPLDVDALNRAVESGEFRDLRTQSPPELPESRRLFAATIDQLKEEFGLSDTQLVVGGFSQGSMLATDYALHAEVKPSALVIWSGSLINESVWRPLASSLSGVPVLQSHGTSDPILPFVAAKWLREMLDDSGANVAFLEFSGPHTIPPEALESTANLLVNQLQNA